MAKNYIYTNKGVLAYNKKDLLKIPIAQGELSTETRHVFLAILNNTEIKTNDDSIQSVRFAIAIDEAEGQDAVELGEGVYDWLKKKLDATDKEGYQLCPRLFRVNGSVVYEFIKDGYDKPHESSGKEKGQGEKDAPETEEPGESQSKEK